MTRILLVAAVAGALCIPEAASALADSSGETPLRLADAQALADRARQTAIDMRLDVSVVIVNREGRVILSYRMDNSSFLNLALAETKAATAAAIGAPTSLLEQAVDSGKHSLLSVPGAAMVGGGLPIMRADRVVGGIGISGGSSQDDERIAKSALDSVTGD
jgi:glc operon protein GlcG